MCTFAFCVWEKMCRFSECIFQFTKSNLNYNNFILSFVLLDQSMWHSELKAYLSQCSTALNIHQDMGTGRIGQREREREKEIFIERTRENSTIPLNIYVNTRFQSFIRWIGITIVGIFIETHYIR